jgi:opacity protein-like surface antigen
MSKLISKILVICAIVCLPAIVSGQARGDIALFYGRSYYLGEINHITHFKSMSNAFGAFYRHNYNLRYSLRGSIYTGRLTGDDKNSPYDYNKVRASAFDIPVIDLGLMSEFNFLPYITTSNKYRFSPYVTAGFAYLIPLKDAEFKGTLSIPFGLGLKYNLNDKFSIGIEWVLRKTFTDELDGLGDYDSNPLFEEFLNNQTASAYRQESTIYRNDYYAFTGLFLSYKITYRSMKCPAYNEAKTYE